MRATTECETLELSKNAYFILRDAGALVNEENSQRTDVDDVLRKKSNSNQEHTLHRLQELKSQYKNEDSSEEDGLR